MLLCAWNVMFDEVSVVNIEAGLCVDSQMDESAMRGGLSASRKHF